jgi:hypothetical protein
MSNFTDTECPEIDGQQVCMSYIISIASVSSLFIISEVLPFLKAQKGNGLAELLICMFEGSDCILSKMIECLKGEKNKDSSVEVEQNQSLQNESKQETNININIERNNNE